VTKDSGRRTHPPPDDVESAYHGHIQTYSSLTHSRTRFCFSSLSLSLSPQAHREAHTDTLFPLSLKAHAKRKVYLGCQGYTGELWSSSQSTPSCPLPTSPRHTRQDLLTSTPLQRHKTGNSEDHRKRRRATVGSRDKDSRKELQEEL